MKLLSGVEAKLVNLLMAMTQASFILILCVKLCQQDYTPGGNLTQNPIVLNLNKTSLETLGTWLYQISTDKDLTVKLRVSTPQELKKRLIDARWMVFAQFITVREAMGCFYQYCSCQEARHSLTEEVLKRDNKKRKMDQMRKRYIKRRLKHC